MIHALESLAACAQRVRNLLGRHGLPAIGGLVAIIVLLPVVAGFWLNRGFEVQDDAWYYWCIARNIARTGVSTFDGQTLTNGYHPLWMLVLVLQHLMLGPSMAVTMLLEMLLVAGAIALFLEAVPRITSGAALLFICALLYEMHGTVLVGMESSLFLFCLSLFTFVCVRQSTTAPSRGVQLGLVAALCAGARLDAAPFVVPIVLFLPCTRRARATALGVLATAAVVYMAFNGWVFRTALPISGSVKGLGGLQVNHPLLTQMQTLWKSDGLRSRFHHTFVLLLLSPIFVVLTKPRTLTRAFSLGTAIGGYLYMSKLLLASSWQIWPWYNYVAVFPLLAALLYVGYGASLGFSRKLEDTMTRYAGSLSLGCTLIVAGLSAKPVAKVAGWVPSPGTFATLNHVALMRFNGTLRGARVAMGDRAGSFAHEYKGPVTQLEGIANDVEYLKRLQRGGDLTDLLCARGVQYLIDYEPDLGNYDVHVVSVLRPMLTQIPSPTITVRHIDEVGRVLEPSIYAKSVMEPDNALYIWRLAACAAAPALQTF